MEFADAVRRGVRIVKLERAAYREVAADPHAFTPALLIVALVGIASWLGSLAFHFGGILLGPLLTLAVFLAGTAIVHFMATLFGGRGDLLSFARVWGTGWVIGWAAIIPWLGGLAALVWSVVVAVVAVEENYTLDRTRAILAVLVPFSAFLLIMVISIALVAGFKSWFLT